MRTEREKWEAMANAVVNEWDEGMTARQYFSQSIADAIEKAVEEKASKCPQCGAAKIYPRGNEPYCEECGWPDEDRTRCDVCSAELTQCGPKDTDGEPTWDCKVCLLSAERDKLQSELSQARQLLIDQGSEKQKLQAEVERPR